MVALATPLVLHLDDLAHANRPAQMGLVGRIGTLLSASPAVTHLLVRGSLASGTADRLSDLDFVIGVADGMLPAFAAALDNLMTVAAGALLPGWRDTIVAAAELRGIGFVFLVPEGGKLQQIDLFLAPSSAIGDIQCATPTTTLLERGPAPDAAGTRAADEFLRLQEHHRPECRDLLIEHLVLALMLHKRLRRGQEFVAYGEWHLMHTATKNLIKAALAPASRFWGWYQLREEIGLTPIGRDCLEQLREAVSGPAIPTVADIDTAVDRVIGIAERACPSALDGLADAITAYHTYMELA